MLKFNVNVLNSNSPKKIKREIENIKKYLNKDIKYFKEIPEEFLLLEDEEQENNILQYAFSIGLTIEDVPKKLFKNVRIRNEIIHQSIIQQESIESIVNILKSKGRGSKEILEILSQSSKDLIVQNPILFEELLNSSGTQTLQFDVNQFFSSDELDKMFSKQDLPSKVSNLKKIYERYPSMIEYINSKWLFPQYQRISLNKLQLIVRINEMKSAIISMNNYELELYSRLSNNIAESSIGWQEFENNILLNFKKNEYKELINDLMQKSKLGNKISKEELEKLTNLLSGYSVNFDNGNTFNITNKEELKDFETIKNITCDTILKNPQLSDEDETKKMSKYLKSFIELSVHDRIKMAILEKHYNLTLKEANALTAIFGDGIEDIKTNSDEERKTIEIIKAIKNICECKDINILKNTENMNDMPLMELSQSILLRQNIRNIYQRLYQDTLYQISEKDRKENVLYEGTQIPVYYLEEDFAMIVKRVGIIYSKELSYRKTWEELSKPLRYKTSVSYMTPENLLDMSKMMPQVILGFSENQKYSIDEMYSEDSVTPFLYGDKLFRNEVDSKYKIPSKLEEHTYGGHNELVINTLFQDEEGRIRKVKPSYIVYIQESQEENKDNNKLWEMSLKAAKDFEIPIVVLDREKIRQRQREQIINKYIEAGKADDRLLAKIYHYVQRYGTETLEEFIPIEIMKKETKENSNSKGISH